MSLNTETKSILNRRPLIKFTAPRSVDTIPEVTKNTVKPVAKIDKIDQLVKTFDNIVTISEAVEVAISARAKNEVLQLNIRLPEDAVVAQAVARLYPEKAKNLNGFIYVDEITFEMYSECLQHMKAAGKAAGDKQTHSRR